MTAITVRNLPEETRRALDVRAARNGRSTAAEVLDILEQAVRPQQSLKIGTELAEFGRRYGGLDIRDSGEEGATEPANFD